MNRDKTKRRAWHRIEDRRKWLIERIEDYKRKNDQSPRYTAFLEGQILGLETAQRHIEKKDANDLFLDGV
jgi:hypothetical protein